MAVTGIRHDAYPNADRIQVEELKPTAAMGTYLHPEAFGQPPQKGLPTPTGETFKATAKDHDMGRAEAMQARLRAISEKPEKIPAGVGEDLIDAPQ